MSMIKGSSGKLIPNPNPTSSKFTDRGTKNANISSTLSSLNKIRNMKIRIKGNSPTQGKSNENPIILAITKTNEVM